MSRSSRSVEADDNLISTLKATGCKYYELQALELTSYDQLKYIKPLGIPMYHESVALFNSHFINIKLPNSPFFFST